MSRKKKKTPNPIIDAIPAEHLPTEVVEIVEEKAEQVIVTEKTEPVVVEKVRTAYVEPKLMIEEVAQTFKRYKPSLLPAIKAFASSRGFPVYGTRQQMLDVLKAFGWKD